MKKLGPLPELLTTIDCPSTMPAVKPLFLAGAFFYGGLVSEDFDDQMPSRGMLEILVIGCIPGISPRTFNDIS